MPVILRFHCRAYRRTAVAAAVAIALPLALTSPARADSDGYYCVGPDYMAYEFSFSRGSSRHELTIIALSDGLPLGEPTKISLPAFQVHGMRCGVTAVELKGRRAIHRVDIIDKKRPTYAGKRLLAKGTTDDFEQKNLGLWAFKGFTQEESPTLSVALPSPSSDVDARLDIKAQEEPATDGVKRRHKTELVIKNRRTGKSKTTPIFEGTSFESVD